MDLGWHMGDVVRKLREQRRWNQTRLATVAKVNKATVVSVEENAPGTKRETYEKLAKAFDLSLGELFSLLPTERGAQVALPGAAFQQWDGKTERRAGADRRVAANDS